MLFPYLLKRIVTKGTLTILVADERAYTVGRGDPHVMIHLHKKSLAWTLAVNPELRIGEAYMNGSLTIEEGTLRDLLTILMLNYRAVRRQIFFRILSFLTGRFPLRQFNPLGRARRNAAFHYDLPDRFYNFFLDADRQYSCAYFTFPGDDLEQAQLDKKRHIASKLLLNRPGLKILDIGSGWGGLALYLAREAHARVTGITLSTRQYLLSQRRAQAVGLDKLCQFALRDYRQEGGPYDRIVSIGMFEHVGKRNYDEFFERARDLLADNGVCLLHTIVQCNGPEGSNAFIRKYIFPGTDVPALSEIMEPVQRSGLFVTDVEILRLHYAETLRNWIERFESHRREIVALYGASFSRRWEYYMIGCEIAFRHHFLMVAQIQLSKSFATVPITRVYMEEWEKAHDTHFHAAANDADALVEQIQA